MKKILIIGGDSQLGKSFSKNYPKLTIPLSKNKANIIDERSLEKAFKKYSFHYVLNCAAITNMDYAEKNAIETFNVNSFGVYLLNKLSLKYHKKLLHISSDYAVDPVNTYGISKKIGEQFVDKKFHVIRTSFYSENTFIIKSLLKMKKINCYSNLFFNPISIDRLTEEIFLNKDLKVIKNYFSNKKISFYDFGKTICKILSIDSKKYLHKIEYQNNKKNLPRKLNSYIKSDIDVDLKKDLSNFLVNRNYEK